MDLAGPVRGVGLPRCVSPVLPRADARQDGPAGARRGAGGLIALHISNTYLDLGPAVAALAGDAGLVGLDRNEVDVPPNESAQGRMPSHWVVLARKPADLARLADRPGWSPLSTDRLPRVWTDDYSDLLGRLRR